MDLHFARSRRRAAMRRRQPAPRPATRWRTIRIAGLATVLFAVVGGSASLEISDAGPAPALALAQNVPESNVLGGARYLRQLLARFGSLELALSAYNAGPTAVEKAGAAPTLETLRYVKNVEARAAVLSGACR